jgi:hypothetical protein
VSLLVAETASLADGMDLGLSLEGNGVILLSISAAVSLPDYVGLLTSTFVAGATSGSTGGVQLHRCTVRSA